MSSETINTAGAFSQAKDLKNRILFTLLLLMVYRLGTYVPLAGIDPSALKEIRLAGAKLALDKNIRSEADLLTADLNEQEEALARAYLDRFRGEEKAGRFVQNRLLFLFVNGPKGYCLDKK